MGGIVSTSDLERNSIQFLNDRGVDDANVVFKSIKKDPALLTRLQRVMCGDRLVEVGPSTFMDHFKEFCISAPEWSQAPGDSLNIFWAGQSLEWRSKVLIIRRQTAGMCSLIAIMVYEHYLMAVLSNSEVTTTYDVGRYLAEKLRGISLAKFLLYGLLDPTIDALMGLCLLTESDLDTIILPNDVNGLHAHDELGYQMGCEDILKRVATRPALLTQVKATYMASAAGQVVFTEPPVNQPGIPRHAMVLVGARKDHNGEYFFLIQNWWKSRYFLELSGRYLARCGANITFLRSASALLRSVRNDKLLNNAIFAETCVDVSDYPL